MPTADAVLDAIDGAAAKRLAPNTIDRERGERRELGVKRRWWSREKMKQWVKDTFGNGHGHCQKHRGASSAVPPLLNCMCVLYSTAHSPVAARRALATHTGWLRWRIDAPLPSIQRSGA